MRPAEFLQKGSWKNNKRTRFPRSKSEENYDDDRMRKNELCALKECIHDMSKTYGERYSLVFLYPP